MKLSAISLNITEKEYRSLTSLSYSFLSALSRLRPKGAIKESDISEPMVFGTMVDSMMDNTFNKNDYYISSSIDIGEKIKPAIDLLLNTLKDTVNPDSDLSKYSLEMITILEKNNIDYYSNRTNLSRMTTLLKDAGAIAYFKSMIESNGKVVITQEMYNDAQICKNILKTHEFTKHIFNDVENEEAFYQFKHKWIDDGIEYKGMIDRLIINHKDKVIKPYDLKTGSGYGMEFEKSFYQYRYDIQAVLYFIICKMIRDTYYPDYTIDTFKFVFIGRFEKLPIIWEVPMKHLQLTINGYLRNGKKYQGIKELIREYEFHHNSGFNINYSKDVYENKGVIKLPMFSINELK